MERLPAQLSSAVTIRPGERPAVWLLLAVRRRTTSTTTTTDGLRYGSSAAARPPCRTPGSRWAPDRARRSPDLFNCSSVPVDVSLCWMDPCPVGLGHNRGQIEKSICTVPKTHSDTRAQAEGREMIIFRVQTRGRAQELHDLVSLHSADAVRLVCCGHPRWEFSFPQSITAGLKKRPRLFRDFRGASSYSLLVVVPVPP